MAKQKTTKRCPRCDAKAAIHQPKCEVCGLIYARMNYATNQEAKRALRKGKRHLVVYDKTLPKDVSKWKLFFLTLFLGLVGGHRFRVGKPWKGLYSVVSVIMIVAAALLPFSWWQTSKQYIIWALILPTGPNVVWWAIDWIKVMCNAYRVPVAIEESVMRADENVLEDKDVIKIVKDLDKMAKEQVKEEQPEEQPEEQLEDKEEDKKEEKPAVKKPAKPQKVVVEKPVEKEPFVPKSKVISSEEVKKLVGRNANSSKNNNSNKKKKK